MSTTEKIYNGKSIRQILSNLPNGMIKMHKKQYINNCIFVFKNESEGYNLGFCNLVRNSNFELIKFYLSNN